MYVTSIDLYVPDCKNVFSVFLFPVITDSFESNSPSSTPVTGIYIHTISTLSESCSECGTIRVTHNITNPVNK